MTFGNPRSPGELSGRHSLRWRLPLYSGLFAALVLGVFLWASYREVEITSERAGQDRAQAAAQQIAELLSGSVNRITMSLERTAADPLLREYVRSPTGDRTEAVRGLLEPIADEPYRRVELWRGDSLLLTLSTVASEGQDEVDGPAALPELPVGPPPEEPGVGPLRLHGEDASYYEVVVEVRDGAAPDAPLLGHLRRSALITSGAGDAVRQLVGSDASMRIGSPDDGPWSDLRGNVAPPPVEGVDRTAREDADGTAGRAGVAEDAAEAGTEEPVRWVGATAEVAGAPWVAWVGFPAPVVTAPARTFLREMLVVALFFILAGSILAGVLGARLARPLHDLARGAEKIAAGDYTRRVGTGRRDEVGRLAGAFNTMADHIERAHGRLEEAHEQTQFALASARTGVLESDLRTDRIRCSDSMHLVLPFPEGEIVCEREELLELVHEEDRESVRHFLEGRAMERDEPVDLEFRVLDPEGPLRWIGGRGRKRIDERGEPTTVLAVFGDMTERRRLESQLRQAQKMEAVGQLAGGVAHDFNNLLTSILGHANLVLDDLGRDDPARDDVAEIVKAARSGGRLTRQLLAFSRRQVMQPEIVQVERIVGSTEKLLRRLIGEDIEFVTDIAPALDPVKVDPGLLEQVLMNLAVNARDAMNGGGRLTIGAHGVRISDTVVGDHGSAPPGHYVVLSVSDTGTGMDEETKAHLFEPFFTTKGPAKGTGLGLATVFGIVKQSGGHIFVETEPGAGTTFEIYLPAEPSAGPGSRARAG